MSNKYAGICNGCGEAVPARCGVVYRVGRKWIVRCPDCAPLDSGHRLGKRCEDAPCCGCCDQEYAPKIF